MGWKASCVLINERGPGFLGTMPPHSPERARTLIASLGLGPCRSQGMTTFDEGINPEQLVVGAYEGAAVIGSPEFIDPSSPIANDCLMARILAAFPRAEVLSVSLASVVNLWGYAFFRDGQRLRAYGGTAESGVIVDEGEWLPEERPHFERSVMREGQRSFLADIDGTPQEFNAAAYGETLTFAVMARFFGATPDQVDSEIDPLSLPMESFERERPKTWWWPFKKSAKTAH